MECQCLRCQTYWLARLLGLTTRKNQTWQDLIGKGARLRLSAAMEAVVVVLQQLALTTCPDRFRLASHVGAAQKGSPEMHDS